MRSLRDMPPRVTVYEVGPRDGLQNESILISTEVKVSFIDRLSGAGLPVIEVSSFVRPGVIPQLKDAEDVVARMQKRSGTMYTALVPNARGMERASSSGLGGIAVFTAASETFSRKNTNATVAETLDRFRPVVQAGRQEGLFVRAYVSTAFGCPYEGDVPAEAVRDVTKELLALGADEVAISDTIGRATPGDVLRVLDAVATAAVPEQLALHFHDTHGTALVNVLTGLQWGITTFDSAAGGLGGCPYAPGATGNLATEDLLYMLDGLGIETGADVQAVAAASRYLAQEADLRPPSRYLAATA